MPHLEGETVDAMASHRLTCPEDLPMTHRHSSVSLHHAPFAAMATVFLVSLLLLQSCKRADVVSSWTPTSLTPVAYLEDGVLTSRVKAALLLSPVPRSIDIGVESHQGVVVLSGMVADAALLDLAVFVAQNVPGVSRVDNLMYSSAAAAPATSTAGRNKNNKTDNPGKPLSAEESQRQHQPRPADRSNTGVQPAPALTPTPTGADKPPAAPPFTSTIGKDNTQPVASPSPLRRLVTATASTLGISSIHDELQIKR